MTEHATRYATSDLPPGSASEWHEGTALSEQLRMAATISRRGRSVLGRSRSASALGGRRKRDFDIIGALLAIILLLPLFCIISLTIKLSGRGPVLYRHRRVGRAGRPFDCLKFRTMVGNSEEVLCRHLANSAAAAQEWRERQKLKDDPRITHLGYVLRRSSADELPQLFNILAGDMSLVGPRPIVEAEIEKYGSAISYYYRARPGLTGAWQVSGRNDVDYTERVRFDVDYVANWRFWRDIVIILKTIRVVATSRGCY